MRVVIVGGGFAAVQFAKTLRSKLRASECEILLFNRENHDPLPAEFLRKETTYADAIKALNESASGHLLVLDEKQRFWGTLDRNDLYQIIARIVVTPADKREDVSQRKLGDLLDSNPIYVTLEDSPLVACATMLDHCISWLAVVNSKDDPRPVGRLRGDRITRRLIEKIAQVQEHKTQAAN